MTSCHFFIYWIRLDLYTGVWSWDFPPRQSRTDRLEARFAFVTAYRQLLKRPQGLSCSRSTRVGLNPCTHPTSNCPKTPRQALAATVKTLLSKRKGASAERALLPPQLDVGDAELRV